MDKSKVPRFLLAHPVYKGGLCEGRFISPDDIRYDMQMHSVGLH